MADTPADRRRRLAKACDPCRRKKLRCDGIRPVCGRCLGLNSLCRYADVHKPPRRSRRSGLGAQEPSELSLADTHSLIGTGTQSPVSNPLVDVAVDVPVTPKSIRCPQQSSAGDSEPLPHIHGPRSGPIGTRNASSARRADAAPLTSDTLVGGSADTRYFGSPSGISLVSIGSNCHNAGQPSRYRIKLPPQQGSWSTWTQPTVQKVLQRHTSRPLPAWTDAFALVKEFFDEEHKVFPCFHPPTFMALLGQQYSGTSNDSPAWWASLNAVLAIAQRRRVEKGECPAADEEVAWGYAANALGTVLDVLMRNTQLISVQALLTIAWFFLGTPNPQPSFMFTGSALRLAHSIGLHRSDCVASWTPIEQEIRTRVFWIAVSFDRELCLRTGRPPAHDLESSRVDLPSNSLDDDADAVKTVDGARLKIARAQAQLAVVQDRIYQKLYLHEPEKDGSYIADSVSALNQQLDEWSIAAAPAFSPDQDVRTGEHHGLVRLYYSYYNCVMVINRMHGREYWMPRNSKAPPILSTSMKTSIQRCLKAARSVMALASAVPRGWKSFYWDILPIQAAAIIILCINAIHEPKSDTAKSDLQAVFETAQTFAELSGERSDTYLSQIRLAVQELYRMARVAVQNSDQGEVPPSLDHHDFGNQYPLSEHHRQAIPSSSVQPFGTPATVPTFPQDAVSGGQIFQPDVGFSSDFNMNGWAQSGQQPLSYPFAAQWGLDMLAGGPFVSFYQGL
ncbi:fungal-specific transcription factor domain-containing protein [Xylariales sp. PMI_506]|nr:fungal-specific transcription factor domain-containing protein [Xylariales sp. PMI_506]